MSARTVVWTRPPASAVDGLRERKKQLMRQQLSDTATEMFLTHGFDAVRVVDVAVACGVSEKTVYNYFPTKESLLLDRWDSTMAGLRDALADRDRTPVAAALSVLADELRGLTSWFKTQADPTAAAAQFRRFGVLLEETPALRAHQRDRLDELVAAAAEILAARAGLKPGDSRAQIAAIALLGLWPVQFASLAKYLDGIRSPAQVQRAVTNDVKRAAQILDAGMCF
ncbi:MAG: TetR/AcrR family transcriptional regulator [Jatrophihabitantaceae bacterium]